MTPLPSRATNLLLILFQKEGRTFEESSDPKIFQGVLSDFFLAFLCLTEQERDEDSKELLVYFYADL